MTNNKLTLWDRLMGRKADSYWGKPPTKQNFLQYIGLDFVYPNWKTQQYIDNYACHAILYSIINAIAKKAAIAPFKVYRIKNKAKHYKYKQWTGEDATAESLQKAMMYKELVYVEDSNHELNALLEQPNKWQKGNEFIIASISYKLLTGNRFLNPTVIDIGKNKGRVFSVINLPPQHMKLTSDGSLYGVAKYTLTLSTETEYKPTEIIHSKYFNPLVDSYGTHLMGLSPVSAGRKNMTRSDSGLNRSVAMLQNAGAAGMLFNKNGGDLSPEQALEMKIKVNEEVLGTDNAGNIAIANGDMGYINFGLNAQDMDIIPMERYSSEQLCNIYGVPPGLFDPDKMSLNNSKEFKKDLITGAVLPELASLRDDLNDIAALYKDESIYIDYDISVYPELQEDQEKLAKVMATAWWFKGNEKRVVMGQDEDTEVEGMNSYLIPNNLIPIEQLADNQAMIQQQMDAVDREMNAPALTNATDANDGMGNGEERQNGRANGKPIKT